MASSTANKNNNNQDDIGEAISALARVRWPARQPG